MSMLLFYRKVCFLLVCIHGNATFAEQYNCLCMRTQVIYVCVFVVYVVAAYVLHKHITCLCMTFIIVAEQYCDVMHEHHACYRNSNVFFVYALYPQVLQHRVAHRGPH